MPKRLRILLVAVLALLAVAAFWHLGKPLPEPAPPALKHSFSKALDSAHNGKPGAARMLYQQLARNDLSAVRRARLYAELPNYPSPQALKLASADLQVDEPLVRHAAIDAVVGLVPDAQRSLLLGPLLEDDDQEIRLHVARALLSLTPDELGLYFAPLEKVLDEYVQLLQDQTEDASAQLQLADIYLHDADYPLAAQALDRALKLAPENPDAVATQVQVLEKQGNAEQARKLLADQLNRHPQSAQLQQELGLWLLAHDQDEYALLALARAVELAPENNDYRLILAKTLHDLEQVEAAQRQLDEILRREPANRRARVLLIDYWKETGQLQNVQVLLAELEQQNPDDPALQQGL